LTKVSRAALPGAPLLLMAALVLPALASGRDTDDPEDTVKNPDAWCDESRRWHDDSRHHTCEVREYTIAAPSGTLTVNGGTNGGIKVRAWNRRDVLIQAKVEVWADSKDEAEDVAAKIEVSTSGAHVEAG